MSFGLDRVSGGRHWARAFDGLNRWGMRPDALKGLLPGAENAQVIEEPIDQFRRDFEQEAGQPAQRGWQTRLATRVRFHIGAIVHRLSFASWPLLPALDRRLMNVVFNAPAELLMERRLEKALLVQRFPEVAAIPREHNSFRLQSIMPTGPGRVGFCRAAAESLGKSLRRRYWQSVRRIEPRRYYRNYDFNGAPWRAVRLEAEPHRDRVNAWLDRKTLDRWLPPPQVDLGMRDPFIDGAARRTLLGFMLWSGTR
jgi:asparagine synthase (glutamine-hydrolysing)